MKKHFILVGRFEGVSLLLILFVTMPLKYMFDNPLPNKVVGMGHGLLFLLYLFMVFQMAFEEKWPTKKTMWALVASVFPFGTFIFERKYLQQP